MATYYDICETGYDGSVWELLNFEGYASKVLDYTDNRTKLYGDTVQTGKYLLNTSNCALYHISSIITYNGYRRIQSAQHVYYLATGANELVMTNVSKKRVTGSKNTWEITWTNPSGITDESNKRKVFRMYVSACLRGNVSTASPLFSKTVAISEKADRRYSAGAIWRMQSSQDRITYQTGSKFMPNKLSVTITQKESDRNARRAYLSISLIDTVTGASEVVSSSSSTITFGSNNDGTIHSVSIDGAYAQFGDSSDVFGRVSKRASLGFSLELPPRPEIGELEYDKNTGMVTCTVENASDTGFAHRDHVDYSISVTKASGEMIYSKVQSSDELTYDFSFDIADRFAFAVGDALIFSLKATAVGFRGVSESERHMVFGIASPPSVGAASLNSGRVFLPISVDATSQGSESGVPITGMKLQLLRSVALYTEASATASENWADTSIADNDQCTGLSIPVEDVTPSAGNATWLRVKYWTHDESIFYSYTRPVRLTFLEIPAPTAADDEVAILSVRPTGEETDVDVHVAWDVAGTDDATHTEVSWSDRENAWKSTDQPKSFTASDQVWDEGQVTSGNKTYHGSTHVVISGMDAGKTYFIRARRVLVPESSQEGTTTYGPYTPSRSVGMGEVAGSVVLYGPRGIDEGNDLTLNWILASDERQLYYRVILTSTTLNDVVLVSANSASTKCTIPWERIRPYHEEYGGLTLVVAVGTESISATSASINVMIYPKATLSMSVSETQRVQPIRVSLASDRNDMPVSIVVNSQNAVDDGMLGSDSVNVADATVYDDVVTPNWTIASEYVTNDLEEAQEALEQAREDYDAAYATLVEARDAYYMAVSTHKTLEDILASMSQDDEGYEDMEQAVEDAAQDVEDALDAYEAVDISTESAAYESAISDYADAEANALTASLDALPFVAEVDVTTTKRLIDGGRYEVSACGSDPSGNAISDVQTATFDVAWSHKAPMPWDEVTLTPVGDVSGNDFGAYVDIQLGEPAGAFESDVYDVYRVSGSYVACIARGVPQNASVHDPFAPFGSDSLAYRVACRTISGDVAWRDYDYALLQQGPTDGMLLVVDWDGKKLEFDRCIDTSDAYGKGGNLRLHLDGSRSMYWREGVSRTGSYSAALLRSYDADAEGLLDELARYSGPCLVRTSDGSAYQADVVVSNVAKTHDSAKLSVQLKTTEMDGDDTFGATVTEGE